MLYDVAPHNMTSNTVPAPYVASASTEFSSDYAAWKAFDGSVGASTWATDWANTGWLQVLLPTPAIVTQYAIVDRGTSAEQPRDWTLQGSNDGVSWVILDCRGGEVWQSSTTKTFPVVTPRSYQYYRLNITKNNGSAIICISEFYLYATDGILAPRPNQMLRFLGSESASNFPPQVNAGPDKTVIKYAGDVSTALAGSATDRNNDSLTYLWEKVSGPGTVTFTNDTNPTTNVTFDTAGAYILKLTADDGV